MLDRIISKIVVVLPSMKAIDSNVTSSVRLCKLLFWPFWKMLQRERRIMVLHRIWKSKPESIKSILWTLSALFIISAQNICNFSALPKRLNNHNNGMLNGRRTVRSEGTCAILSVFKGCVLRVRRPWPISFKHTLRVGFEIHIFRATRTIQEQTQARRRGTHSHLHYHW